MRLIKIYEQVSRSGKNTSLEIHVNYDTEQKEVKNVSHIVAVDNETRKEIDLSYIFTEWFEEIINNIDWWEVYGEQK